MRRWRVRIAPHHVVVMRQRAIGVAAIDQHLAEADQRVRMIWRAAQRLAVFALGVGRVTDPAIDIRQAIVRRGVIRVGLDRGIETCNRVVEPTQPQEGDAQVVVRLGVARRQAQRLAERTLGLGVGLAHETAVAQVVVRVGEVWASGSAPGGRWPRPPRPARGPATRWRGCCARADPRAPSRPHDGSTAPPRRAGRARAKRHPCP